LRWAEYEGTFDIRNNEEAALGSNRVASTYGSGRVDFDFDEVRTSTFEAGMTQVENEVYVTGIGRVQVPRAIKPWARINYSDNAIFVQFWGAGRDSREPQISLSSGLPLIERSFIGNGEIQYRTSILEDRVFLIGGLSMRYQTINTERTLMLDARKDNATGVYAQAEYSPLERLKLVGAARWDQSTLHENQLSPKVAAVWTPVADHSFRATYNEAFQSPNLSELFLRILRTATSPFNSSIKSYSAFLGNPDLRVEKIRGYELGYKGILNNALFVTVDGYYNVLTDFISDLIPVGANQIVGGDTVRDNLGQPVTRTVWSYRNAGKVSERGFELGVNYYVSNHWLISTNYAYFDHTVLDTGTIGSGNFLPNAPRHKMNAGLRYTSSFGLETSVRVKHVPSFDWTAGIYQGRILAYTLVDLSARYHLNEYFDLGLNVSNILNRKHYQIFGGSLLGRHAVISLTATF
jgi:outer membrane receptor protein involved in Fe transport